MIPDKAGQATLGHGEPMMRSLIKLVVVLVICVIGLGFYLGWFSLSKSDPKTEGDKVNVNVSLDKNKMKSDVKKAEEKVKEEIKELKGKGKPKEEAK
jgi:hypothetical protein